MRNNQNIETSKKYWKPQIQWSYKSKIDTVKINGQMVETNARFEGYDLQNKQKLDDVDEVSFMCETKLSRINNQDLISNYVANPFTDIFRISAKIKNDKGTQIKYLGEAKWSSDERKLVGINGFEFTEKPPSFSTCLLGIDAYEREIEIVLSSTVAVNLFKPIYDGEENPKAIIMREYVPITLSVDSECVKLNNGAKLQLLLPTPWQKDYTPYIPALDKLKTSLDNMLDNPASAQNNEVAEEEIIEEEVIF